MEIALQNMTNSMYLFAKNVFSTECRKLSDLTLQCDLTRPSLVLHTKTVVIQLPLDRHKKERDTYL